MARLTGASVDEVRYLEQKGYLSSVRTKLQRREVREFSEVDFEKLRHAIKYRRQGFTWDASCEKARADLVNPGLFDQTEDAARP
jgi:DNA-binding transcriptional MerR regulator